MSQVDIVQKEGVSVYIPYIAIVGMEKETLLTAEKYDVKLSPCRFGEFSYGGFIQTLREGMTRFDGVIFSTTFDQILTEGFNFVKKMIALGVRRMLILCEPFSDPMDEYSFIDIMKDIGSYLQEIGIPTDRFSHIVCEVKEHGMNEDYLNGVRELYQQINDKIILPASEIKPFLMPIDDVISLDDPLNVLATGRVIQGSLKRGDAVEIVGFEKRISSQVCMLETSCKSIEFAEEGDTTGVILKDVSADEIERGMVVATPDSVKMAWEINTVIYALTKDEDKRCGAPVNKISRPQFCINGVEITCMVQLPNDVEFIFPGDCCSAKISLIFDIPYISGTRFTLCGPNYIAEGSIV